MSIIASLCHGSLTATFTLPAELILISWEQINEELKNDSYAHCFVKFPSEDWGSATVYLDTIKQFSSFVSWLTGQIEKNW